MASPDPAASGVESGFKVRCLLLPLMWRGLPRGRETRGRAVEAAEIKPCRNSDGEQTVATRPQAVTANREGPWAS